MKILFLNNYFYLRGGSERILFDEIEFLKLLGHNIVIFSRSHPYNLNSFYEKYFPPEMQTDKFEISINSIYTLKEIIYSKNVRIKLRKIINNFKPTIAHAHNIYGRLSFSVIDELKKNNIPIILTLHDFKFICPSYLMLNHGKICEKCKKHKYYYALITKCHKNNFLASTVYAFETFFNYITKKYEKINYFVSPSKFLINKFIEFGWNPKRLVHIPNFVDSKKIKYSPQTGDYLLYFGRLSREKGVKTLLSALYNLNSKLYLLIVGDGPERMELEKISSEKKINVKFTGYLNGEALQIAILKSKAIIMPSEWYENAPLSILEAFAYGKPVIGSRIGGIPEMIDDGVNGFLFEPGNVDDLRNKMELLLSLPDERIAEMGRSAREKVEREYNPELHYERLMEVYQKALSNR